MPDEGTPLITTVRLGPPRRRYPHNVARRFCTIALSSTLVWFFAAFLLTAVLDNTHRLGGGDGGWSWPGCNDRRVSYEQLRQILLDTPSGEMAQKWSRYYTAGPHLAGQNLSQAEWTRDRWEEWGIASEIVSYDVYLNRPEDHRLALLESRGGDNKGGEPHGGEPHGGDWTVAFEASLKEDVLDEDPTSADRRSIPTFHGYSASGNVTGRFVYVNYGTFQDFEDLLRLNVSLAGNIAIARYGGIFRGLKIKRAQELGMTAVVLYSDPGDDGENTVEKGAKEYPDGPARQASSVQRGSAQFISIAPGDPTTPGYPSKPGAPRVDPYTVIPTIPSLPISYSDALPILRALNGHGPSSADLGRWWTRNQGLAYKGVQYGIGPSPPGVTLNLYNKQNYVTTPVWNVIGVINGSIPDEVVVVGNHRDAWIVGGAGDPNSGSAALNEVVRSFGKAVEAGWKPLRTIVFASWDGEEYALIGSTEWVEEHLPWLSAASVAYLNVDVGTSGNSFKAAAAPLLHGLLHDITSQVQSPNQTVPGQTVRDTWSGHISTIGSGSDFTAFQDFAGVASVDMGFVPGPGSAVYHYHSNYDSFHWMAEHGDPGFAYHRTMAQILGLMTAKLVDTPVVSFGARDYADALAEYVAKVEDNLDTVMAGARAEAEDQAELDDVVFFERRASHHQPSRPARGSPSRFKNELARLHAAVFDLALNAVDVDARADELRRRAQDDLPWWKWPAKLKLGLQIRALNTRFKLVERQFLYAPGLDGRNWFKSVVFAPGMWTGYAGAVFPGLQESIDARDFENAVRWVDIIENCIIKARKTLDLKR